MSTIQPFGFYVFRRPFVAIEEIFSVFGATKEGGALEEKLLPYFQQLPLQEAICLASPAISEMLQAWLRGEPVPKKEKFLRTLLKYFIRAGIRCTPFGMFAGCTAVGYSSGRSSVQMSSPHPFTRSTRLNAQCTVGIAAFFDRQPDLRRQMRYYPNQSLYRIGNKYHYTYYLSQHEARQYSVCSVESTPYLEQVFEAAAKGALVAQLATAVAAAAGSTPPEAENFIFRLIEEQLLISEIQPTITGPDFLDVLVGQLGALERAPAGLATLTQIQGLLRTDGPLLDRYTRIRDVVHREFGVGGKGDVLQTDLSFPTTTNTLSRQVMGMLTKTFNKLLVLNQGVHNPHLEDFKERFYKRFEAQEVPLLEALDGEVGIPYGEMSRHNGGYLPLLASLYLPGAAGKTVLEWNYWKEFILSKYSEALLHQSTEIELTDADLNEIQRNQPAKAGRLPKSLFALGSLQASSWTALESGDFVFNLNLVTGPSAANLLSRFCHADEELLHNVRQCTAAEEAQEPEAIFAEIVHLPEAHIGNILKRPSFYQYEIPYLARPSVADAFQISLSDLTVSVRGGREIILRSRRHNKRVFPRLTTAHNFKGGLGIYKFLCDLQYEQSTLQVFWHWSILEKQNFLPRVRYRNVVLSRATWRLEAAALPDLATGKAAAANALRQVRVVRRMPRYVLITENDNELLMDFENAYCLELLREELLKKGTVTLKEFLQMPDQCLLGDAAGRYTNEIIIPFRGEGQTQYTSLTTHPDLIQRRFIVGSEWLYLKIYTGEKFADNLLKNDLKRLSDSLLAEGVIDQWFFVRYVDPEHHLRLRFHGDPRRNFYVKVLTRINASLTQYMQQGRIHRIQTDTYVREVERYGSKTMVPSEELFFRDSHLVTHFLRRLNGDAHEKYRWLFALRRIDALLDDFGYTLSEKHWLLSSWQQRSFEAFSVDQATKKQLNEQYRKDLPAIRLFLEDGPYFSFIKKCINRLIDNHRPASREAAGEVAARVGQNRGDLNELLASYVHMFMNRLFSSDQRSHELVLYHYLHKYHNERMEKQHVLTEPQRQ